jgi:hypothetical protein
MDLELKSGLTVPSTKENGAKTKPTVRVNSGTLTVTSTKASGKMTKPMATESTCTSTEPNTKAIGRTIYKTALVLRAGQMALNTREATKKE